MLTHRDLPVPAGADVWLRHADVRDVHAEMTTAADDHPVFTGWLDVELADISATVGRINESQETISEVVARQVGAVRAVVDTRVG